MRVQPAVGIVAPADAAQARTALRATVDEPGPVYYRLCKEGTAVPGLDGRFELGRAILLGDGRDVALVALGNMAGRAALAADELARAGIASTVVVVSSLNPSPIRDLAGLLEDVPLAVSIEAHYLNGGLGSLVAEVIAEHSLECRLVRRGVADMPRGMTGSSDYLYQRVGLSHEQLAQTVAESLDLVQR